MYLETAVTSIIKLPPVANAFKNIIYEAEQRLHMGYCVACGLVPRLDRDRKEGMYLK